MSQSYELTRLNKNLESLFGIPGKPTSIPELNHLKFFLLDGQAHSNDYTAQNVQDIWRSMPYWAFLWAGGLALAEFILARPPLFKNRTVIDWGAGSGVVAIAAAAVGARKVIAIDIDPMSIIAIRSNLALNNLDTPFEFREQLTHDEDPDAMFCAADVFYDGANEPMIKQLQQFKGNQVIAERSAFDMPLSYEKVWRVDRNTIPNIGGFEDSLTVNVWRG